MRHIRCGKIVRSHVVGLGICVRIQPCKLYKAAKTSWSSRWLELQPGIAVYSIRRKHIGLGQSRTCQVGKSAQILDHSRVVRRIRRTGSHADRSDLPLLQKVVVMLTDDVQAFGDKQGWYLALTAACKRFAEISPSCSVPCGGGAGPLLAAMRRGVRVSW